MCIFPHIFHKWSRWQNYNWHGTMTPLGCIFPKEVRGISISVVEGRSTRACIRCGKKEDIMVREGGWAECNVKSISLEIPKESLNSTDIILLP